MFNAYEVFGLKPVFGLDLRMLEEAYVQTVQSIHPDRHTCGSVEEKRQALEKTTRINEAYRILKDPLLRAEHLWKLGGYKDSFETGTSEISASSEILRECIALRECLEEEICPDKIQHLLQDVQEKMDRTLTELHTSFETQDRAEGHRLIERLGYLRKIVQEAQEKLWILEDDKEEKRGVNH